MYNKIILTAIIAFIAGAVIMGILDASRPQPFFSQARMSNNVPSNNGPVDNGPTNNSPQPLSNNGDY
jgi:hypothetical protein